MRLSTVILPVYPWAEGQRIWRRAEELGFHTGYTYDHLSWRSFRDGPWFGTVPTLAAAASATGRMRLGTLVTSPNFRHPVTLAKEVVTLDDISGGRFTLGVGAGGEGFDATALGGPAWTRKERTERFAEFVPLLDELLTREETTREGRYYSASGAQMLPGCTQRPRVPFYVAATGPRGLALAAAHGQGWITYGDPRGPGDVPAGEAPQVVAGQLERLGEACERAGRDPGELAKVLLQGSTAERPMESLDAFVDWAGRYQELGLTELVLHWPVPGTVFGTDPAVFERIATDAPAQLRLPPPSGPGAV